MYLARKSVTRAEAAAFGPVRELFSQRYRRHNLGTSQLQGKYNYFNRAFKSIESWLQVLLAWYHTTMRYVTTVITSRRKNLHSVISITSCNNAGGTGTCTKPPSTGSNLALRLPLPVVGRCNGWSVSWVVQRFEGGSALIHLLCVAQLIQLSVIGQSVKGQELYY
jgi:hypothetical protein